MTVEQQGGGKVLDARGLLCPLPVVNTSKAIKLVSLGEVLEVLTTDPGSKADLIAWAKMTGHELVDLSEVNEGLHTLFKFYIRRMM